MSQTTCTTTNGRTSWLTLIRDSKQTGEGDLGQTLVRLARLAAAVHHREERDTDPCNDMADEEAVGGKRVGERSATDRPANGLAAPAVANALEEARR